MQLLAKLGEIFVPKDTYYQQAKSLMAEYDADQSGYIEVGQGRDGTRSTLLGTIDAREGFATLADLSRNGKVSVGELRKALMGYDGSAGARDGVIDGAEWLVIWRDAKARVVPPAAA